MFGHVIVKFGNALRVCCQLQLPHDHFTRVSMEQEHLETRSKNKEQRPGQPDQKAKRRSRAEMEEYREEQAAKKREAQMKKNAVINRIAQMEDDMATQDRRKGRNHPQSRKGNVMLFLLLGLRY